VIPEIDIWRAATLMLRRYSDKAEEQSAARVDHLTTEGDHDAATWRRIADAVRQLANMIPAGPLTLISREGRGPCAQPVSE
jgi:hypothetical protein